MPRHIERDFSALARSMNERNWSPIEPADDLTRRCLPDIEASAHRSQARYLAERRARLVKAINEASETPAIFWWHRYFRHLPARPVLSSNEAVMEVRREIVRAKNRSRLGRWWIDNPANLPELQEAMVFARWFRRYSKYVWDRRLEAA